MIARKPPLVAAAEWLIANKSKAGPQQTPQLGIEGEHLDACRTYAAGALLRSDFQSARAAEGWWNGRAW